METVQGHVQQRQPSELFRKRPGVHFLSPEVNRPPNTQIQPMKLKKLYRAVLPAAALCLACAASAQDNRWNGTATNNLWNVPGNWSLGVVPPPGNPTTTFTGNVFLDSANGNSTIVIPAGDVESPGVGNSTEVFNSIF